MRAITTATAYDYLLALPRGYSALADHGWPLLCFLHGARERGPDFSGVTRHGPPKLLGNSVQLTDAENRAAQILHEHFIVVSPRCAADETWDDAALLETLDYLTGYLNVDPRRVYLTGLSMGGFGTWTVGLRHPERFAALAPVCGGGRLADIAHARGETAARLRSLPIWAFHGARDRVVPLEESERMVAALREAGNRQVKLTVYPETEHDAWNEAYSLPELYAWLLLRSREDRR